MPPLSMHKDPQMQVIDLTPENIAEYGVCGYKDVGKNLELRRKIDWMKKYYPKGLRIKAAVCKTGGYQGMLEYIPGEYAHRPVNAKGYMFIHCIFVGFRKESKGKGYASALIDECVKESKKAGMLGVAVVTRKGPFMSGKEIFLKKGFSVVGQKEPDFELLAFKFNTKASDPEFMDTDLKDFQTGLTVIRSAQCPYSVKNVDAILKTASKMGLKTKLVELEDAKDAQRVPCAFGTFCIIHDGNILTHHPISNTRFENIMRTEKKTGKRTSAIKNKKK